MSEYGHTETGLRGPVSAAVRETHVGVVVLLGSRAYKLKKPVRTDFLDYSTPDRRLAACRRELELNRRLAPDVYLGLAQVANHDDPSAGPGQGSAPEPLLVMRRMPDERRLTSLIHSGADVRSELRALAKQLAAFHTRADRGPHIDAEATTDAVRRRWSANIAELRAMQPCALNTDLISKIESRAVAFLAGREPLFANRIASGRVLDGHGDLLADDIFCLDDGPRALDCLEFDDRLRYLDGLDDVAAARPKPPGDALPPGL
jgi:aminoglycoside phosphotransferase family enzyme